MENEIQMYEVSEKDVNLLKQIKSGSTLTPEDFDWLQQVGLVVGSVEQPKLTDVGAALIQ